MRYGTPPHRSDRPFAGALRAWAIVCILALASTGLPPGALAISDDPPPGAPVFADDPLAYQPALDEGPLGPGRQAYRERRNPERARESYELFKRVVDQDPDDHVALWHLAMSCYYLGQRVVETKEERKRVFAEGHVLAENAVERDPSCAPCHMLAGVNQALWGQEMGIFRVLSGLPNVKRHLRLSTELDPAFAGASALRVRSQIARVLPRWLGGGKDKARRYLSRAVEIAPNEPLNYQFLSNLLWKEFDDRKRALAVARRGLAVPEPGPEFVESVDAMRRLRKMVRKLEQLEQREKLEKADEDDEAARSEVAAQS